MAIIELFRLFGSILIEDKEANKSISKTEKNAGGLGKTLGKGIKTAAKWGVALAGGALIAVGGMIALGSKIGNMADELLDLNSITGMSTDSIQQWRKVTEVAGVATNAMTNASAKLTKSLDAMSVETDKGAESLGKLGLSFEEIESMSADERMNVLTEALSGVDDKTERARIGTDLFGKSWAEIAPVVDLGTEAMQNAKDSANIISEEDLKKANDFRISIANMKDQVGFFVTEIGIKLLPMLQRMFDWIQEKMPLMKDIAGVAFEFIGVAITTVSNFIRDEVIPRLKELYAWIEPHFPMIKDFFMETFGIMKDIFMGIVDAVVETTKWMKDHWNIVGPIFAGIAAAILTFQLITAAIAAYGAITKAITAVQIAFNLALSLNPIGLVVLAIGALVTAGVLLWKNWDTVKEKAGQFWTYMKDVMRGPVNFILGAINTVIGAYEKMINGLSSAINKIPKISIPSWVPGFGGKEFGIPNIPRISLPKIPMLAEGGDITQRGSVMVGEAGPEILDLPKGARVTPLDKAGGQPEYIVINNYLDGKKMGEVIAKPLGDRSTNKGRGLGFA